MNQKLIDEINIELESMAVIVSDIELLIAEVGNSLPSNVQITALGGFAAQFYNGVENILKRIHKSCNITIPQRDDWHITLLKSYSIESNYKLPVKFSNELLQQLTDYRRFRHYFFHGYSSNLNWEILSSGVSDIRQVFEKLINELQPLYK